MTTAPPSLPLLRLFPPPHVVSPTTPCSCCDVPFLSYPISMYICPLSPSLPPSLPPSTNTNTIPHCQGGAFWRFALLLLLLVNHLSPCTSRINAMILFDKSTHHLHCFYIPTPPPTTHTPTTRIASIPPNTRNTPSLPPSLPPSSGGPHHQCTQSCTHLRIPTYPSQ